MNDFPLVCSFTVHGLPEVEDEPPTLFADSDPSQADRDRMHAIFAFLCPESDYVHRFLIPGIPLSKRRARLGKGGRFYSEDRAHEKALGLRFRHLVGDNLLDGNIALGCIFFRPNRRRIDVDNLMKLVMDAATSTLWRDDCQVTAQLGIVEVDRENPRTLIVLGRHRSTLDRTYEGSCEVCGKPFARRSPAHRFCSNECRNKIRKGVRLNTTHCRRGHLLDAANTALRADGTRRCRRCAAERAREYRRGMK